MPLIKGEEPRTEIASGGLREPSSEAWAFEPAVPVQVRRYSPEHREGIRNLCCNTGFLGAPIDSIFQDRELFADLFTGPYLEHEPDWAFVAEAEGRVVGYLLASVSKHFDFVLMRNGAPVASKMLYRLLTGRYARHPRSAKFVRWLLTAGYQEQPKHPDNSAHLHFDLDNTYRGRGVCRLLWRAFETQLRTTGVTHCYGSFLSHPRRRPELVYVRYGFRVFDRRRTTMFHPEVSDAEVICMHRELRPDMPRIA